MIGMWISENISLSEGDEHIPANHINCIDFTSNVQTDKSFGKWINVGECMGSVVTDDQGRACSIGDALKMKQQKVCIDGTVEKCGLTEKKEQVISCEKAGIEIEPCSCK